MSAVPKQDILPFPEPESGEPEFLTEERMFQPPEWGKHTHSEVDLRRMWSRIWKCFRSRKLCEGFIQFNKLHSIEVWCAAFEDVRQSKNKMDHIHYVKRVADAFSIRGTPAQVAARELAEAEAKAAAMNPLGCDVVTTDVVRKFWEEKGKSVTTKDIPDDDPVFLRMYNLLKGGKK